MFRRHWRCCALQYRPLSKMNCKASCPRPRIALPATKQHGIGFGASNAAGIHEREANMATQAKVARRAAEERKARAIADVWDAIAERKRKREQERPQRKEAEPKPKQRRQENGTEMTTEGPAEVHGQQDDSNERPRAVRPRKAAEAMAKGSPHCNQSVSSTVRTGQVNHRRTCGNFFPSQGRTPLCETV